MPTRTLGCLQSFCLALCFALSSAIPANPQNESSLATRIEKALRAKEPDWKYIGSIESRIPLVPSETRIITGIWTGPKSRSQDVNVSVYSVENRLEAAKWLGPVRDKHVAAGWEVSAFQIGDEGYLSKYKNGDRFEIEFRRGTVVAKIAGDDLERAKEFAQCVVEQVMGLLASVDFQITVDATKQLAGPPRGRGPFPGSDFPGHSAGLPVRLELVVKFGELSADGTILVDFLITNVHSDSIRLPSSVRPTSGSDRPYYLLTLWLTGDAIKKQYAKDQQTGRLFEIGALQTNAELHADSDAPVDSALLSPGASMLVHGSSRAQVNPGSHSITAHAVLERFANGRAELLGNADSETLPVTFTKAMP